MSAVAGYWDWGAGEEPAAACRLMVGAQRAYGPHAVGEWAGGNIALGRCLFRTVPEDARDDQPLTGGGGRYVLVADLRLDNRAELLGRLGLEDAGQADSNILLAAWEAWGEGTLERLVGPYAFALWDKAADRLMLARDPIGERPLFYALRGSFFAFSSMPRGLHALAAIPRAPDPERVAEFIGLVSERGRASYYEGVEALLPGHVAVVTRGAASARRFWTPEHRPLKLGSFGEYREAFRERLDTAVGSSLRGSGGSVASHLSAGWDSSAVTATAARLLLPSGGKVDAFTAVPREGSRGGAPARRMADEGPTAAATARLHPNVTHHLVRDSGGSPLADLPRFVELFDRPVYGLCNFTWVCEIRQRAAARGNSILLTGQLGNYTLSSAPIAVLADLVAAGRWRDWWREARVLAKQRRARYRGIAANSFGPWLPEAVWQLVRRHSSRPETAAFTALHPALEPKVNARREALGIGLAARPKDTFRTRFQGLTASDKANYRKGALAGWGIDERDPTGDLRLVEFCLSLPVEMLLKDGARRPLARAALSDRLPPQVLDETRKGYQRTDWHEALTRDLATARGHIEAIGSDPLARRLVDVAALRGLIESWPTDGWEKPETLARYRNALLTGISAGYFVRSAAAARQ
jgi:asparagine synthase (glutamine-hydrolysing)